MHRRIFELCDDSSLEEESSRVLFAGDGVVTLPIQGNDPACNTTLCNIRAVCDMMTHNNGMSVVSVWSPVSSCLTDLVWCSFASTGPATRIRELGNGSALCRARKPMAFFFGSGFEDVHECEVLLWRVDSYWNFGSSTFLSQPRYCSILPFRGVVKASKSCTGAQVLQGWPVLCPVLLNFSIELCHEGSGHLER